MVTPQSINTKQLTVSGSSKVQKRRAKILKAAIKAFAEKGFDAASTRVIATNADIEQGHLTYHFPNKELLWRAAADQIFGEMADHVESTMETIDIADPKERTRHGIREIVHYLARTPELFRFLVDAGNRSDDMMRWLVDTHLKPRLNFMIQQGVGSTREIDPALIGHAFFALSGAASFIFAVAPACRRLTGIDPRKKAAIDMHAEFLANLMVP